MSRFEDIALKYVKAGYSVIPVGTNKVPTIRGWRDFQTRPMTPEEVHKYFQNSYGMALVGGVKGVTIVDIDLKNDLTGDYYQRLEARVPAEILDKMYIQTTKNNGVHWIFRSKTTENNQKLAMRFTTVDERHQVYIENFENPLTKDKAFKIASHYNTLVICETRSNGGYALISPTPGYEWKKNKIGELTEDEYEELMNIIRSTDEVNKVHKKDSRYDLHNTEWEITPFRDANDRLDVPMLLESNGWSQGRGGSGRSVRFKRPGRSSPTSAIYDTSTRLFSVFSTSTDLDVRAYTATDLFTHFECNGDIGEAYKKLIELDYGVKKKN